jgi:hypothetical protein
MTAHRNEYPFSFHTPSGGITTIRNIVYGRPEDGVEDKEDAIIALTEVVEQAMERAFRIGLQLGIEKGKEYVK